MDGTLFFHMPDTLPLYGLPDTVAFCRKCVMPNTRPSSTNEYKHHTRHAHTYIHFDSEGVCAACRFCEAKFDGRINWTEREKELQELLNRHRRTDGRYDVLVPGSGGKDSCYAAHVLKYKYGMHPLTVTWAPHLYTDIGWKNFQSWNRTCGADNVLFTPNPGIHRLLTRNAFLNLLHPFQPFIIGQKIQAVKTALQYDIPLIFMGENPGEYGANISIDQKTFTSDPRQNEGYRLQYLHGESLDQIFLGGTSVAEYHEQGIALGQLEPYFPADPEAIEKLGVEFHYLGAYLQWHPQGAYYYASEHCDFEPAPARTPGTYSRYNSLDDKTDDFFYYTSYIKFGYGRATHDASQEIRHHDITREEGVSLVRRFDGEFPERYFKDFLQYVSLSEEEFVRTIDSFRDPHLWIQENGEWKQRYKVS